MTNEQREAIEDVEEFNNKFDCGKYRKSINTVLSLIKENSAEIQQKNTELAEKSAEIEKLKDFINYLQLKNIEDLNMKIYMANFINDNTPYTKDTKELENEEGIRTVDFTVKYFERKVKNDNRI